MKTDFCWIHGHVPGRSLSSILYSLSDFGKTIKRIDFQDKIEDIECKIFIQFWHNKLNETNRIREIRNHIKSDFVVIIDDTDWPFLMPNDENPDCIFKRELTKGEGRIYRLPMTAEVSVFNKRKFIDVSCIAGITSTYRLNFSKAVLSLPFNNWYIAIEKQIQHDDYANIMQCSKIAICPIGNGIDTERFWESISFGCIPIIDIENYKQYKIIFDNIPYIPTYDPDNFHQLLVLVNQIISQFDEIQKPIYDWYLQNTPNMRAKYLLTILENLKLL